MTYYSGPDFLLFVCLPDRMTWRFLTSGPRGIRTPDLLNAIETRSQLRYGPLFSNQLLSDQRSVLDSDGPLITAY